MRLLYLDSSGDPRLTNDLHDDIPPYAILSHTWGADHEEVTFEALCDGSGNSKADYSKLQFCGRQAREDKLEFFWVDTCCINKANHVELSEALNSMYRWYQRAEKCYVYLSDVSVRKHDSSGLSERTWESAFRSSKWFTRGWTLQELLAPASVEFFSREGQFLGNKNTLDMLIQDITRIPISALRGAPLADLSINERMRWAEKRETKRVEDKVYCLLGIFEVFMTPIYGEGENALIRLKDEIARSYRVQLDGVGQSFMSLNSSGLDNAVTDPRREILDSLSFDQMDSRRSTIKSAYSSTCKWLLVHPAYTTWMDATKLRDHNGFLWINGKPGAGKSTLVKFAHVHADKERTEDEIVVSFFFNARGDELEKSTIGMYRALLFQLLKKVPYLQDICNDVYSSSGYRGQGSEWTTDLLCECFSGAVANLGQRRLKCFIDALDECDEQQIQEMIVFFEELGQAALLGGRQVYVCFASRHYPTIDTRGGCQLSLEDEDGHFEDLAKYVRNHLRAGRGKYVEEIKTLILEKANGVFMWVVLVVDILNREFRTGRIFAVQKRLEEIPAKLGDLFRDILRRDHANMDDLLLCLQWILFARRPLGREEFYFAVVAGLAPSPENITAWNPENITTDDMSRFVLNSSKGLAELTKSKVPTVQFIHESVRDFLIKDGGLSQLWPHFGTQLYSASHDQLKQCCLNYLNVNSPGYALAVNTLPKASSDAAKDLRQQLNIRFPFLEYASRHVLYHADEAASEISQANFLEGFDLKNWLDVRNQFERFGIHRHTSNASLGYILGEYNFARLIDAARHCGYNLNSPGERYRFPLFVAIANGHQAAIGAILQQDNCTSGEGAITNLELGQDFSVRKHHTPLLWALEKGHETLAEVLVASKDANLCLLDRQDRAALPVAVRKGYERVVNLLLTLKAVDVNATDQSGQTALFYAAHPGRVALVELLLERGADVHASDSYGGTALVWAARNRREATVKVLLERRANIEASHKMHGTALVAAAQNGDEAVVKLVLENGANTEATDYAGCTALVWAARIGNDRIVQLLLEREANLEASDGIGRTALVWAAGIGGKAVVQLLLKRGANTEASDTIGRTALMCAASNGETVAVELLLERGANTEAKDGYGRTSLSYASEYGDEHTVRILLASNASVNTRDKMGQTALSWAIASDRQHLIHSLEYGDFELQDYQMKVMLVEQHNKNRAGQKMLKRQWQTPWAPLADKRAEVIRLLIANGAQVDAVLDGGATALALAAQRGWDKIVQLFRQQGTDIGETKPESQLDTTPR